MGWLGKLNRSPKAVREEFCMGSTMRATRKALEQAGHAWKLPEGSLVFVHPWQYQAVMKALSERGEQLFPDHVVFTESLEHLVAEVLAIKQAGVKRTWMK